MKCIHFFLKTNSRRQQKFIIVNNNILKLPEHKYQQQQPSLFQNVEGVYGASIPSLGLFSLPPCDGGDQS